MTPAVAEIREQVQDVMRRHGVVTASVSGTMAHGDDHSASDVDFLVEFEEGRTLLDLSGLRLDLEELLEREVDVATPNSLRPQLRETSLKQRVRIF